MPHPITVPPAGESITSATLSQWHKNNGDPVKRGDLLATLETDKVSNEIEAEQDGSLEILIKAGEEVSIGTTIGRLHESNSLTSPEAPDNNGVKNSSNGQNEVSKTVKIKVPPAGDSITSATVAQWHVKDGDIVAKGSTLVSLETDKVSNELEAPTAGAIHITTPQGQEVPIGTVIATINTSHTAQSGENETENRELPQNTTQAEDPESKSQNEQQKPAPAPSVPPKEDGSQAGLTLLPPAPQTPDKDGNGQGDSRTSRSKMSPLRKKIANHLLNAQHQAAILTTFNEVDMSHVMTLRKQVQDDFMSKHGVKLGFMSFFAKACVQALKDVPQINARIDGDEIVQNHYYDLGIAIGTDRGLVVPVLRDPHEKSFAQIEQDILTYAEKARSSKLQLHELQGGVFTISNGGVYGSLLSTPILNPPQSGILGMHSIQQRPIALNGEVVIRPMMYLALSYDHRIIDGKEAVTFLLKIKNAIENPTHLLLDI